MLIRPLFSLALNGNLPQFVLVQQLEGLGVASGHAPAIGPGPRNHRRLVLASDRMQLSSVGQDCSNTQGQRAVADWMGRREQTAVLALNPPGVQIGMRARQSVSALGRARLWQSG